MVVRIFIVLWVLLFSDEAALHARVFADQNGRTIEAQFVEATDSEVVVKLLKSGGLHRLKIVNLSSKDVEYIAGKRAAMSDAERRAADEAARLAEMKRGASRVVDFVLKSRGRKIGDGECWSLADEAFKAAGIKRPGKEWRIWGGVVNWEREDVLPGDVLELRAARFTNGRQSGPKHTAVVVKRSLRKGEVMVAHQNWGISGKKVSVLMFHLDQLEEGEATVYRYGKR